MFLTRQVLCRKRLAAEDYLHSSGWSWGKLPAPKGTGSFPGAYAHSTARITVWSVRGRPAGPRAAQAGDADQAPGTTLSNPGISPGTCRRDRHPGTNPPAALADG